MVTRAQRLRKECRDGHGLERMAEMLYAMANDPEVKESDRVAAAREWRQVMRDLGGEQNPTEDVVDEVAAARKRRRTSPG